MKSSKRPQNIHKNLTAENTEHPTYLMFVAARVSTGIKWAGVKRVTDTGGKMGAAYRTGLRCISLSSATTFMFPEIFHFLKKSHILVSSHLSISEHADNSILAHYKPNKLNEPASSTWTSFGIRGWRIQEECNLVNGAYLISTIVKFTTNFTNCFLSQ